MKRTLPHSNVTTTINRYEGHSIMHLVLCGGKSNKSVKQLTFVAGRKVFLQLVISDHMYRAWKSKAGSVEYRCHSVSLEGQCPQLFHLSQHKLKCNVMYIIVYFITSHYTCGNQFYGPWEIKMNLNLFHYVLKKMQSITCLGLFLRYCSNRSRILAPRY